MDNNKKKCSGFAFEVDRQKIDNAIPLRIIE